MEIQLKHKTSFLYQKVVRCNISHLWKSTCFEELQAIQWDLSEASQKLICEWFRKQKLWQTPDLTVFSVNSWKITLEIVDELIFLNKKYKNLKENQKAELIRRNRLEWVILETTCRCQIQTLSKAKRNKIPTKQRTIENSVLGIRLIDRITNIWIRKTIEVQDDSQHIAKQKWRYIDGKCNSIILTRGNIR